MQGEQLPEKPNKNLVQTFKYFTEKIDSFVVEQLSLLLNIVSERVKVVFIQTDTETSAFRLFETLNDRGLELSALDLVKNDLLRKGANESGITKDNVLNQWISLTENLDVEGFNRKVRFLRQYYMAYKEKITEKKVYDKYKEWIRESDISQFSQNILSASNVYRQLLLPNLDNDDMNDVLKAIHSVKAQTSYTLLMKILLVDPQLTKREDIIKILKAIEVFAVRRSIASASTAEIDSIYSQLALEIEDSNSIKSEKVIALFKQKSPTDELFKSFLMEESFKPSDNQTRHILSRLEASAQNNTRELTISGTRDVHVEHIMPNTFSQLKKNGGTWLEYLKKHTEKAETEIKTLHSQYKNKLGNLVLLSSRINQSISDGLFEKKLEAYQKSNFKLVKELSKYKKWDFDSVQNRTGELADISVKIWSYESLERVDLDKPASINGI